MKLGGRKQSGNGAPATLDPLGEDEIDDHMEERRGDESQGAGGRERVGARLLGNLFADSPSDSADPQSVGELRRTIRQAAVASRGTGHVAAAAPMTAGSRNLPFVTPAGARQSVQTPRWGSAVTGSSRPGVVARLDMDRGVPGGRFTGQSSARGMPPPREAATGRLRQGTKSGTFGSVREPGRHGTAQPLQRGTDDARDNSSSVAPKTGAKASESFQSGRADQAWSFAESLNDAMSEGHGSASFRPPAQAASRQTHDEFEEEQSLEYQGSDTGLRQELDGRSIHRPSRGRRESSASRQSVSGWQPERLLSPPLQLEVDALDDDPDDVFDLLGAVQSLLFVLVRSCFVIALDSKPSARGSLIPEYCTLSWLSFVRTFQLLLGFRVHVHSLHGRKALLSGVVEWLKQAFRSNFRLCGFAAPLKAQDLNFHSPRGSQGFGRTAPSG